jgi:hypothetical protein
MVLKGFTTVVIEVVRGVAVGLGCEWWKKVKDFC